MNKFILKKIPSQELQKNFQSLIGKQLNSIQTINLRSWANSHILQGQSRLVFSRKAEKDLEINFLDIVSDNHQSPVDEDLLSLVVNFFAIESKKNYSQKGTVSNSLYPNFLVSEIIPNNIRFPIARIELYGTKKSGKIIGESYFMKAFQFSEYDIEIIDNIVFYHSNNAISSIHASSFSMATLSFRQTSAEEDAITKFKEHMPPALYIFE